MMTRGPRSQEGSTSDHDSLTWSVYFERCSNFLAFQICWKRKKSKLCTWRIKKFFKSPVQYLNKTTVRITPVLSLWATFVLVLDAKALWTLINFMYLKFSKFGFWFSLTNERMAKSRYMLIFNLVQIPEYFVYLLIFFIRFKDTCRSISRFIFFIRFIVYSTL